MSEPVVFRRTRVIEPDHVDLLEHVNNVVWLRFVIALASAHAQSQHDAARVLRETGGQWIVRRHELDYHANAGVGTEIVEETWVERMRGASSLRRSRFTREDNGSLLVSALTQWAYVDAKTLRPRRIPAPLRRFYELESPSSV